MIVFVEGKGFAVTGDNKFIYADKWSDSISWGGERPPIEGDSVHIPKGQVILVDTSVPHLKAVNVEGVLIFEDRGIKTFEAEFIVVLGGRI